MKKVFLTLTILAAVLTSCNNKKPDTLQPADTAEIADSTSVDSTTVDSTQVDTTKVDSVTTK